MQDQYGANAISGEVIAQKALDAAQRKPRKNKHITMGRGVLKRLDLYKVLNKEPIREGFTKKIKKMVGFIQSSSDPSQPGRGMDKKKGFLLLIVFTN